MKHIIVPIDFSDESINGLRLAILLANRFEARIQMVYVQKYPSELGRAKLVDERKKAIAAFTKLVDEYKTKLHDDTKLAYIVKKGKIYQEVVNQAEAFDDSIIVCSTHGASGFEDLFIGSNAFKIISASEIPVITIRHGTIAREINTIIMPIDWTIDTRQKAPLTAKIAKAFNSQVHVVGILPPGNDDIAVKVNAYCKQVSDYLKEQEISYKLINLSGKNTTTTTIEYAIEVKADLISIMTEQDHSFSNYILGTQAQQMLNKSPVPVLSVTPKEIFIMGSFSSPGALY